MASGIVGVAVNVGGTIGVSEGTGVDVATDVPPPQAFKATASITKRIMNLGRTNFLQKQDSIFDYTRWHVTSRRLYRGNCGLAKSFWTFRV